MNPILLGTLLGGLLAIAGTIGGTLIGHALARQEQARQRQHDIDQRAADRLHDRELRADDRQERLELHWLDTKHEVYAQFLGRMTRLLDAVQACFSTASMSPYMEDGRQKWQELPYPTQLRVEAQETLDQLVILAPEPVAQTAFDYMVHVAHWYYHYGLSYVHDANNRGVDVPEQLATKALEATAANHEKRQALVAAIRQDLGLGAHFALSAHFGPRPPAEEAQP